MATSPAHKYAVTGAHPDQLNIDFGDGVPQGPGAGHYLKPEEAFIDAGDWLWVFAEASRQLGRGGAHGVEWDAFIFQELATKMYGFTTPEPQGHNYAESPGARIRQQIGGRLGGASYKVVGYIHSHRSGASAFGDDSNTLSRIGVKSTGHIEGDLAVAYMFSPQDILVGLRTPTGAVKRVRLLAHVKEEINRARTTEETLQIPSRAVLRILQRPRHLVFLETTLRKAQGQDWAPGKPDWRKKAIDAAARELMHHPRNAHEARRFDKIRSAGGLP